MSLDLYNYRTEKPFTQKNLVTLQDYSRDEIYLLLSTALDLKKKQKRESRIHTFQGKLWA